MKVKRVLSINLLLNLAIIGTILFVFGVFYDATSDPIYIGLAFVITLGLFSRFLKTRKYFIAIENDHLSINENHHIFSISILKIEVVEYSNHCLKINSNGMNYKFDLFGYSREKVEHLIERIKSTH
jgi:membrane protein YdbS with pleckstrin-like domain